MSVFIAANAVAQKIRLSNSLVASTIGQAKSLAQLLLLSFVLVGCVNKPVRMDAALLDFPDQSIHVVVGTPPVQGKVFKEGSQGLLDVAINDAMASGTSAHLATLPAEGFEPLVNASIKQLESRNVTVTRHPESIVFADLKKRKRPPKGQYKKDLSSIIESTDANYILLLHCEGYGASRSYYGFIPTSYPQAVVTVTGVMIDREHQIQWNHSNKYLTYVGENWKQPPEYPLVTDALSQTWKAVEQDITGQLIGNEPIKQANKQ